jgi:transposase
MFPNSNYFDIYHLDPMLTDVSVWDYGYSYLANKVCHDMNLWECLTKVFKSDAMDIVVMAAFMIREGNAMDGLDDWQQRNYFQGADRLLTSQVTSRIFGSITGKQLHEFFKMWVKTASGDGSVFYDVTSFSSYAQEMTAVERGYNRDGEDLPQYNLGMFCDERNKTPLYYNRYNGSLTDRTNLSYVLANAKAVGIDRVKMVLDGGFWSQECFASLHDCCEAFTVGMPIFLKEAAKIIEAHGEGIESYANELQKRNIYCVPANCKIYGISGRVLVYYDSYSHVNQCCELSETIDRLKSELAGLKRYPKNNIRRYDAYFILTKHEQDSGFDYIVDNDKIEKLRKAKGYFLIFSTDMQSTPADILGHYRAKDADEKLFSQIKVDMDGGRTRTHNESTTDGKTFVTFIACIIRSYMLGKLSDHLASNSTSLKKVFNQLSNISIISTGNKYRFTKALTKKQKQILTVFEANDSILSSIK